MTETACNDGPTEVVTIVELDEVARELFDGETLIGETIEISLDRCRPPDHAKGKFSSGTVESAAPATAQV